MWLGSQSGDGDGSTARGRRLTGFGGLAVLLLNASVCGAADPAQALADARAEAKRWQVDAVLVRVTANGFADMDPASGRVLRQTPAKQLGFTFMSAAAKQGLTVMVGDKPMMKFPMPLGGPPNMPPLPEKFVGVDAAIAAARQGNRDARVASASLEAYTDRTGRWTRAAWQILFSEPGNVRQSEQGFTRYVDAQAGTVIAAEMLRVAPGERPGDDGQRALLAAGVTPELIRETQEAINKLRGQWGGLLRVTGRMDDETRAAIFYHQRNLKLPTDGQPSRELLAALQRAYQERSSAPAQGGIRDKCAPGATRRMNC
jgi:putative peptidoglycan binding protein